MPHFNYQTIPWERYPSAYRSLADRLVERIHHEAGELAGLIRHKGSASFYLFDNPQAHTVLKVIVYHGNRIKSGVYLLIRSHAEGYERNDAESRIWNWDGPVLFPGPFQGMAINVNSIGILPTVRVRFGYIPVPNATDDAVMNHLATIACVCLANYYGQSNLRGEGTSIGPAPLNPAWMTPDVERLTTVAAREAHSPSTGNLPPPLLALADALEEAGCTAVDILAHLRSHPRSLHECWLVNLLLSTSSISTADRVALGTIEE